MDEFRNFLRDRECAGRYFVDGGMYATLCLHLCNPWEDAGYMRVLPDNDMLDFAIDTLPFYLSRADYEPNLAIHAHSLLSQKIREGEDELLWKRRLLHEAIDLYLKVSF